MNRSELASWAEWLGTLGAVGLWTVTGVYRRFPGQGTWLVAPSYSVLLVGAGLLVIALFARRWRTGRFIRRTPFDWPLALFLVSAVIGWWIAYDHERNLLRLHLLISAVAVFYLLAGASAAAARRFVSGLVLLATVLSLYYWTQHDFTAEPHEIAFSNAVGIFLNDHIPQLGLSILQPLNENVVAGLLAVAIPFNLAWLNSCWRERRWLLASAGVAILSFSISSLLLIASWGAWAALVGAGGLWMMWRFLTRMGQEWPETGRQVFVLLSVLSVGIGLYVIALSNPDWLPGAPWRDAAVNRLSLYQNSLYLIRDYLFSGAGLGMFPMVYASYSMFLHVGIVDLAHSWYLDVWFEQGLLGLIAALWMAGIVIWLIGQERRPLEKHLWHLEAAAWSSVVLIILGLMNTVFYPDARVVWLFAPFGLIMAGRPLDQARPKAFIRQRKVCISVALATLAVVIWHRPLYSAVLSNLGAVTQTQRELAAYSWPEWPIQDAVRRQVDLTGSEKLFERTLAYDPNNVTANRRLGMIALSLGEYAGALEYLEGAYASTPGDNATRQLLGEAYLVNGMQDRGAALWKTVNDEQGQLGLRSWWYGSIGDPERATRIEEAIAIVHADDR